MFLESLIQSYLKNPLASYLLKRLQELIGIMCTVKECAVIRSELLKKKSVSLLRADINYLKVIYSISNHVSLYNSIPGPSSNAGHLIRDFALLVPATNYPPSEKWGFLHLLVRMLFLSIYFLVLGAHSKYLANFLRNR